MLCFFLTDILEHFTYISPGLSLCFFLPQTFQQIFFLSKISQQTSSCFVNFSSPIVIKFHTLLLYVTAILTDLLTFAFLSDISTDLTLCFFCFCHRNFNRPPDAVLAFAKDISTYLLMLCFFFDIYFNRSYALFFLSHQFYQITLQIYQQT